MDILAFADLHGNKTALEYIKRKSAKADLIVAAGDLTLFGNHLKEILRFIEMQGKPIVMVHGNHESEKEMSQCSTKNIHFVHNNHWEFNGVLFIGWGGGGFATTDEYFERIAHKYKAKMKGYDKVVFVTHQPPYGTKIDKVYGHFAGNKSFTGFIKETQPILAISGHLHETAGKKDMIGKTLVINPGPKGTLIKLVD